MSIFSDEKNFVVDRVINRQNSRYIAHNIEDTANFIKFANKTKKPASVMVLGILGSDGSICSPIFIPEGLKVNTKVYLNLLEEEVLPLIEEKYGSLDNVVALQHIPAKGPRT